MTHTESPAPVLELRVALTTAAYERLLRFYTLGLGLAPAADWSGEQGRVVVMDMGRATLEVFDEPQADYVDRLEAGQRLSGPVRLALRVPDVRAAVDRLLAHGATLVRGPALTPWGDLNARVQDPDGMQVTLFQEGG